MEKWTVRAERNVNEVPLRPDAVEDLRKAALDTRVSRMSHRSPFFIHAERKARRFRQVCTGNFNPPKNLERYSNFYCFLYTA